MLIENVMNFVLRFLVGLKLLFNTRETLENFIIPLVFACFWLVIYVLSMKRDGEYGAPAGLLYMQ